MDNVNEIKVPYTMDIPGVKEDTTLPKSYGDSLMTLDIDSVMKGKMKYDKDGTAARNGKPIQDNMCEGDFIVFCAGGAKSSAIGGCVALTDAN